MQIVSDIGGIRSRDMIMYKRGSRSLIRHIRLGKTRRVTDAVAELSARMEVEYAQSNYIHHASAAYPDDPDLVNQWGLHNTGQTLGENTGIAGKDIHAPEAWDTITDCSQVVVAVVDTGVSYTQRDHWRERQ